MKKLLVIIMTLLLLTVTVLPLLAKDTFVIGVAPHTSARIIMEMYQPLRLYMEERLGMQVDVVTAKDFDTFAHKALQQEYDIAITTSHQARLLQTDARYIPLLTYRADFKAVLIVAKNGPVKNAADLKDKEMLGLSATSLVTLWGQHWMTKNRLDHKSIKYVSASDSVAQLVATGEAAGGFTSLTNFQKLAPAMQTKLRILDASESMPGRIYLLNARRNSMAKKIRSLLWDFGKTETGKRYFDANQLGGYRALKTNELKSMDHYANETKILLKK